MSRRNVNLRGPPFVEIRGNWFLNLAFDLEPLDVDIREIIGEEIEIEPKKLLVLRLLTTGEARAVQDALDDAMVEAWALVTANKHRRG